MESSATKLFGIIDASTGSDKGPCSTPQGGASTKHLRHFVLTGMITYAGGAWWRLPIFYKSTPCFAAMIRFVL